MHPVHESGYMMDPVHTLMTLMDPDHGPGPRRGSIDQGSCPFFSLFPHSAFLSISRPSSLLRSRWDPSVAWHPKQSCGGRGFKSSLREMFVGINTMMQRTANENAAGIRRICKRSDQPKIERLENNGPRLILRRKLNGATT